MQIHRVSVNSTTGKLCIAGKLIETVLARIIAVGIATAAERQITVKLPLFIIEVIS